MPSVVMVVMVVVVIMVVRVVRVVVVVVVRGMVRVRARVWCMQAVSVVRARVSANKAVVQVVIVPQVEHLAQLYNLRLSGGELRRESANELVLCIQRQAQSTNLLSCIRK